MKSQLKKISVVAALLLFGAAFLTTGCGGHPAYKLESGESSKVRLIEKDGELVKLEVNRNSVKEVAIEKEEGKQDTNLSNENVEEETGKETTEDKTTEKDTTKKVETKKDKIEKESSGKKVTEKVATEKDTKEKDTKEKDRNKKGTVENKAADKKTGKIVTEEENKNNNLKETKKNKVNQAEKQQAGNQQNGNRQVTKEQGDRQPAKKKVWVPDEYKIVKHPAVKKEEISVHWICQCGEIFYSDEDWQAHRPKP